MSENELTPEERAAFGALPREREPSRLLEERTVAALRERGHLRPGSRAPRILRATAAAAAVAVFLGGFAAGRVTAPDSGVMGGASVKGGASDSTATANHLPAGEPLEPLRIVWL